MLNPPTFNSHFQVIPVDHVPVLHTVPGQSRCTLQKVQRWTGAEWKTRPYDKAKGFFFESRRIHGVHELSELLIELESDPHACVIRGELATNQDPRARVRRTTTQHHGSKGFFDEKDRTFTLVDLDEGDFPFEIDPQDPAALEAAALWARDEYLGNQAPELYEVACVAQWSASAFLKDPAAIKLHLWFWFDRPICAPSLNEWLKQIGADPALSRTVQPHYTAPPAFFDKQGRPLNDPLNWRTRLLPGLRSVVTLPPNLLDSEGWKAKVAVEKEAEEARQEKNRREALKRGPTDFSEDRAQAYLSNALDAIKYATHGTRHNTVYGQSYWIGRVVAGENGLPFFTAKDSLESAVKAAFAGDSSLSTEMRAVQDGLKAGLEEPFYAKRRAETQELLEHHLQPATASFLTLRELRAVLSDEVKLALATKGTTVLVTPTGGGKTYAAIKTLVESAAKKKALWACFSNEERDRVAALFRAEGRAVFVAKGHNEKTCPALQNYLYASELRSGSGHRFCREVCPHRHMGCRPPALPPDGTTLVICTHQLAASVASAWEPKVLVWDEGAKYEGSTLNSECLGRAVGRGEVTGDTTEKLLALLSESYGRKIPPQETESAIAGLEVTFDEAYREQAFADLCQSGCRPKEEEKLASWRALDALRLCAENGGKGAYIYNGELKLPGASPVPSVPTRLVLDATATPLASQAIYGDHDWRCLTLAPNPYVTHLHIEGNGGKSTRRADGTWEVQQVGRLDAALREALPEALQIKFKDWREHDEEEGAELTHYGAVDSRGSNRWRERREVVAWDFYVNKETREARVILWAEKLKAQGFEPDLELLAKEAEWQLEIAPMVQGVGRLRLYEATAEKPKLLVTIGKKRRMPPQGGQTHSVTIEEALWLLRGELSWNVASDLLRQLAQKRGGLWWCDLDDGDDDTLLNNIADLQTDPGFPIKTKGLKDLFASQGNQKEKYLSELREAWRHTQAPFILQVSASLRGRHGVTLRFIPGREGDRSGINQRAQEEEWRSWTVTDQRGNELAHFDSASEALKRLPAEAHTWREVELAGWLAREAAVSLRTARARIAERGGLAALREELATRASQGSPAPLESPPESPSSEEEPSIAAVYAVYDAAYRDPKSQGVARADKLYQLTIEAARKEGFEFTSFDREIFPLLRPWIQTGGRPQELVG